jgi:hypothetical protein
MEVDDDRRWGQQLEEEEDAGDEGAARLAWERDYERTWEVVQEDATGALDTHAFAHAQQRLRRYIYLFILNLNQLILLP